MIKIFVVAMLLVIISLSGIGSHKVLAQSPGDEAYSDINVVVQSTIGEMTDFASNKIEIETSGTQGLNPSEKSPEREDDPYLVFYGNYCGIGNKSPDYSKPSVDVLDELCKIHDFCYETFGHGACNCDMQLMNNLVTYQKELPRSPKAKVIITSMKMLFGKNACDAPVPVQI